jgi:hypothetical protein
MAQAPTSGSAPSGGGSKGGGKSSGAKSTGKGAKKSGKSSIESLANNVPAHHAHHGMSGTYDTKGKFGGWPDGKQAFGEK